MFQSIQRKRDVYICYECEFRRDTHVLLAEGLNDVIYLKLENDGHLILV